jgi:hypothetical protein
MKTITLLLILVVFVGCSKKIRDNSYDKIIIGVWINDYTDDEYSRISRIQYSFKEDNTLEILRIEMDVNTRKILGYRYKSNRNYWLDGNQLSFSNIVNYTNDGTQGVYSAIEDLKLVSENSPYSAVTCKFEDNNSKLTFINKPMSGVQGDYINMPPLYKELEVMR